MKDKGGGLTLWISARDLKITARSHSIIQHQSYRFSRPVNNDQNFSPCFLVDRLLLDGIRLKKKHRPISKKGRLQTIGITKKGQVSPDIGKA